MLWGFECPTVGNIKLGTRNGPFGAGMKVAIVNTAGEDVSNEKRGRGPAWTSKNKSVIDLYAKAAQNHRNLWPRRQTFGTPGVPRCETAVSRSAEPQVAVGSEGHLVTTPTHHAHRRGGEYHARRLCCVRRGASYKARVQ